MTPFDQFIRLFPLVNIILDDDRVCYKIGNKTTAAYFEQMANQIILANGLPLTANVLVWERGGYVLGINLVIEMVPEEYVIEKIA